MSKQEAKKHKIYQQIKRATMMRAAQNYLVKKAFVMHEKTGLSLQFCGTIVLYRAKKRLVA
jgi:hypothetical protein